MKILSYIALSLILFSGSCVKNNPDPSWIQINAWTLEENTNLGTEGELSHNFSDVYITVDDKIIGIFELPIKLPLLLEGTHKINLYPVVRNNGISASKKIYPFCDPYSITVNLVKNEVLTIEPLTKYNDFTDFWIEDFEDAAINLTTDPSSTGTFQSGNTPGILKYGNFYGHIHVTAADSVWFGLTNSGLNLPKGNAEVYLEIDYRNDNSLLTGLMCYSSTDVIDRPNIQLNPQDAATMQWKKIYIDLHELVSASINSNKFEQYFKVITDLGEASGDIYIDNIKVVHF